MGVSFLNEARIILSQPDPEWVKTIQPSDPIKDWGKVRVPAAHYFGDVPLWIEWVSDCGTHIQVTSNGYGVFDFAQMEMSKHLNGIVSRVEGCQSQDIDYVISADWQEMEEGFDWSPYEDAREDDYQNFQSQSPDLDWDDEEYDQKMEDWEKQNDRVLEDTWDNHLSYFPEPKVLTPA